VVVLNFVDNFCIVRVKKSLPFFAPLAKHLSKLLSDCPGRGSSPCINSRPRDSKFRNCRNTLPRRLQPTFRLEAGAIFVFFSDRLYLRMVRCGDAAILVNVMIANLQIAAAQFGGDMHQVRKVFSAPAVAHMKMKTAPVVMLDEMTIGCIRTLVRLENRGRMHSAMKTAHLISRLSKVLGNELVKPSQRFGFFATFEFLYVTSLDINSDRLLEWARHANVPRPYHPDFINNTDPFGIARANRRPHSLRKRTINTDVAIMGIVVHVLGLHHDSFHV